MVSDYDILKQFKCGRNGTFTTIIYFYCRKELVFFSIYVTVFSSVLINDVVAKRLLFVKTARKLTMIFRFTFGNTESNERIVK